MSEPMLRVENLNVNFNTFDGQARVIDGVSLHVQEKETVGLVGETGCGKSVVMKVILRILPIPPGEVAGGKVTFEGKDILHSSEDELRTIRGRSISMIPQNLTSLNPTLTVGEQLTDTLVTRANPDLSLVQYYRSRSDKELCRELREKAVQILRDVALPSPERVMKSYPFELSGGMKQRIMIAMALSGNPSLVLADEPGTALDVTTQNVILELLKTKTREKGLSVIYVTHNLAVAAENTQRTYVMYAGQIVEVAGSNSMFSDPKHPYSIGLIESIPKLTGSDPQGIPGRIPSYYQPPSGCRFWPRCEHALPICKKEKPDSVKIDGHIVNCHLFD